MRNRGCTIHYVLQMCEIDGVQVFATPSHNIIDVAVMVENLTLPQGTPEAEALKKIEVLVKEVAAH